MKKEINIRKLPYCFGAYNEDKTMLQICKVCGFLEKCERVKSEGLGGALRETDNGHIIKRRIILVD